MDKDTSIAIVFKMIELLRDKGNWAGETSIHKSIYILKQLTNVPVIFSFTLYLHGPFSFDLRDELSSCIAYDYLCLEYVSPIYGPKFQLTDLSKQYLKSHNGLVSSYLDKLEHVSDIVSNKGIGSLEKLATALFVIKELNYPPSNAALKLNELKPHISIEEANKAVETMQRFIEVVV